MAEKSAVNDAGVMWMIVVEFPPAVVVVPPDPDEFLDELPQALVARTTPTVTANSAVRFETRIRDPLFSSGCTLAVIPI
jgi:hypothetical protein